MSPLEFETLADVFLQLLPAVALVVKSCSYYKTQRNLLRLLAELVSLALYQAHQYLQAEAVMTEEPGEVLKRIGSIKRIIHTLRAAVVRTVSGSDVHKLDCDDLFGPVNRFEEQLEGLDGLLQSISDYLKLDKLDLGGVWVSNYRSQRNPGRFRLIFRLM